MGSFAIMDKSDKNKGREIVSVSHYFLGWPVLHDQAVQLIEKQKRVQRMAAFKQIPDQQDLHITAVFLGAVEEEQLKEIDGKLKSWIPLTLFFELGLEGIGTFGHPKRPRVIYNKVKANQRFMIHREELFQKILTTGLQLDQRPFTPHITLAKKWNEKNKPIEKEDFEKINQSSTDYMPVNTLNLYQVNPGKTPRYETISAYGYERERD